ncbi:hypothetical protein D3C80_1375820 [compost metagenome]
MQIFVICLQKISWCNFEDFRKCRHHINSWTIDASLQRTNISPVNTGQMRKFLLRQSPGVSQQPEVARKNLTNIHYRSHAHCGAFLYGVNSTNRSERTRSVEPIIFRHSLSALLFQLIVNVLEGRCESDSIFLGTLQNLPRRNILGNVKLEGDVPLKLHQFLYFYI